MEIHMAHGYLVNSFMSPRTNKRVDEFGGNFENRMRFSRLIVEEVKKRTEGKIAVLARITVQKICLAVWITMICVQLLLILKIAEWMDFMYHVRYI